MIPKVIRFVIGLLFLLTLSLWAHQYILDELGIEQQGLLLFESYVVNYLLVVANFLVILIFIFKKQNASLGFLFMGSFLIKMAVFSIFFYPTYREDHSIVTTEFFAFFAPYSICLVTETIGLVRMLNKS